MTDEAVKIIKEIESVSYPDKRKIEKKEMDKFEKTFVGTMKELEAKQKEIKSNIDEYYKQARKAYYDKTNELEEVLKESVRNDFGMDKKVFDIVWQRAYEKGHSGGYEEVIVEAGDLFEFVNDIIGAMK